MHVFEILSAQGDRFEVTASYFVEEDAFVTFKGADHKQLAAFQVAHVVGIVRKP